MSDEQAIRYRAPYTTNSTFRKRVNAGEIAYNERQDLLLQIQLFKERFGYLPATILADKIYRGFNSMLPIAGDISS